MFLFYLHQMVRNDLFCFIIFIFNKKKEENAKSILRIFKQIEQDIKGRGLLVHVNCEYEY
jgi:hypothetical protein